MSATRPTHDLGVFARLHEAVNSGDAELVFKTIDEVVDPDVVVRTPLPIDATGAQALKEVFGRLLRAFPDLHIAVEDVIAEGDKIVYRNTVTGTHQGEHLGIPPTGRSISYNEIFIFRHANGRITETWGVVDVLSQMRQLGIISGAFS
ncbi:ester cyclase [Sphaerisporangium sp. NPDC005288]|uniref:ester cyclase n=1 Tax=Sphaerisporangium sp. NPDC005288 TaxID=3155114 RepID=UPI0033BAE82C